MTLDRAIDLMINEQICVEKASGKYLNQYGELVESENPPCKRDCLNCPLLQDDEELLRAYAYVTNFLTVKHMMIKGERNETQNAAKK